MLIRSSLWTKERWENWLIFGGIFVFSRDSFALQKVFGGGRIFKFFRFCYIVGLHLADPVSLDIVHQNVNLVSRFSLSYAKKKKRRRAFMAPLKTTQTLFNLHKSSCKSLCDVIFTCDFCSVGGIKRGEGNTESEGEKKRRKKSS